MARYAHTSRKELPGRKRCKVRHSERFPIRCRHPRGHSGSCWFGWWRGLNLDAYGKATVTEESRSRPDQPERESAGHSEIAPCELLWGTIDPYEIPLVMPSWARSMPALAKQIDDGYALRRAAGLPTDSVVHDPAWKLES